jgi:hypothetical protein
MLLIQKFGCMLKRLTSPSRPEPGGPHIQAGAKATPDPLQTKETQHLADQIQCNISRWSGKSADKAMEDSSQILAFKSDGNYMKGERFAMLFH